MRRAPDIGSAGDLRWEVGGGMLLRRIRFWFQDTIAIELRCRQMSTLVAIVITIIIIATTTWRDRETHAERQRQRQGDKLRFGWGPRLGSEITMRCCTWLG